MNLDLKGKNALVTGGSHGIGRTIALTLAQEGCNVAVCARGQENTRKTMNEIKQCGVKALAICYDLTKRAAGAQVVNGLIANWGTVHILINNVGGGGRWGDDLIEQTEEKVWHEVYRKNVATAFQFTTALIPYMKKQQWGRVICVASIFGREGGGRPWFNMAKASQISLMKCLALNPEYRKYNITFNSVAPGPIWIEGKEQDKFDRYGMPEDVANIVAFLCSEKARWINGACIAIDGGEGRSF
jgi:3-oxoacyl-[acyl-carrier protein] reductase